MSLLECDDAHSYFVKLSLIIKEMRVESNSCFFSFLGRALD